MNCRICKKTLEPSEAYEYRGAISCEEHFDQTIKSRDFERAEVIAENKHQTAPFIGIPMGDDVIGRVNRKILKGSIEIAKKETMRTKLYERGDV